MQKVLDYRLIILIATRNVPNVELDLLWLAVLAATWHLHNLEIVLDT